MSHTNKTKLQKLITQLTRFGFIGIFTTAFGLICYYIFLERLKFPLYPTYAGVYTAGVCISYYLNSRYTFQQKRNLKDAVKYYASYVLGFLIGLALLYSFEQLFNFSDFILIILTIPLRVLLTFILVKKLVFKNSE